MIVSTAGAEYKKEKENMYMKKKGILLLTILALMIFCVVGCGEGSDSSDGGLTIDLNKYVNIKVSGYSSMGEAEVSFDSDAFASDYKDKITVKVEKGKDKDPEINLELNMGNKPYKVLRKYCIGWEADNISELSNGDVIKVKWKCDDQNAKNYFDCNLKYSEIEYKVENLKEVDTFDPFDYVKVEINGVAPNGSVNIIADLDKKEMQYIELYADKGNGLSNGDKVVVTANVKNIDNFVKEFNKIPGPVSKEFSVEGLPSYVNTISDIGEKDLDTMKKKAEEIYIASWLKTEGSMEGIRKLTYIGNYFLTKKEDSWYLETNQIYMVFKVDAVYGGIDYPHYMYVKFSDIAVDESGNCVVDFSNYKEVTNRWWPENDWGVLLHYYGYGTLEELYNDCVLKVIDSYAYEKNIIQGE